MIMHKLKSFFKDPEIYALAVPLTIPIEGSYDYCSIGVDYAAKDAYSVTSYYAVPFYEEPPQVDDEPFPPDP